MSLDWDVSKVADDVRLTQDPETGDAVMNPVTNAIIWATIAVGIGEITEKNAREFYTRLHAWELSLGAYLTMADDDGKRRDYLITPEDIRAHIGLRTNVFPYESATKWSRKLTNALLRCGEDAWRSMERKERAECEALAAATE